MGNQTENLAQGLNFEAEASRQKMREVMKGLGEKRMELGVLSIGVDPNDPDERVDIFIEPVKAQEGLVQEEDVVKGGSDIVIATTEGFFAIRYPTSTPEGKEAASQFEDRLSKMWKDNGGIVTLANDGTGKSFRFDRELRTGKFVLRFDAGSLYAGVYEFAEGGRTAETSGGTVPVPKLVPVGKETVETAFDASRKKARLLNMPSLEEAMRLKKTNAAADFLLEKLNP